MTHRRVRRIVATAAVTVTCAATFTSLAATTAVAAPAVAPLPANLVPVVTHHSLLGTHVWYRQSFHGLPVLGTYYARHFDRSGKLVATDDGRQAVPATLNTAPSVASAAAVHNASLAVTAKAAQAAKAATGRAAKNSDPVPAFGAAHATLAVVGGSKPALVWDVLSESDSGETQSVVDAQTGATRSVTVLSKYDAGSGNVFDPNPVVKTHDESLTDMNDSNTAVPNSAYERVRLAHLNSDPRLSGRFAYLYTARGPIASSPIHQYVYLRGDDRFEQVNAYYGIDKAQTYIQSLGFADVNNEPQDYKTDIYPGDNSFYNPATDRISYGSGGVDDAEDLEVVWHEYGHAIQDAQVPGYGSSEQAGATGEGFGDYWAVTMSEPTSHGFDIPCVMDWDSTSYTSGPVHCLRRTDTGKTTDDLDGEVHDDGEIWSNALWDINQAVGRGRANTLILEAQFSFTPDNSFAEAATQTVDAAQALYGSDVAQQVKAAFVARKILS